MILLVYQDWFGTAEELKEWDEAVKAVCAEVDGIEYKGRYLAHNRKYHFVRIYEVESYQKFLEVSAKMPPRDYKKLTHTVPEILTGPVE